MPIGYTRQMSLGQHLQEQAQKALATDVPTPELPKGTLNQYVDIVDKLARAGILNQRHARMEPMRHLLRGPVHEQLARGLPYPSQDKGGKFFAEGDMLRGPTRDTLQELTTYNLPSRTEDDYYSALVPREHTETPGFLKLLEVFSAASYAIANAANTAVNWAKLASGAELREDQKGELNIFKEMWKGLTLQDPETWSGVLRNMGWTSEDAFSYYTRGAIGFILDIAIDPLTYMTVGVSGVAKKAAGSGVLQEYVRRSSVKFANGQRLRPMQLLANISDKYVDDLVAASRAADDVADLPARNLSSHVGGRRMAVGIERLRSLREQLASARGSKVPDDDLLMKAMSEEEILEMKWAHRQDVMQQFHQLTANRSAQELDKFFNVADKADDFWNSFFRQMRVDPDMGYELMKELLRAENLLDKGQVTKDAVRKYLVGADVTNVSSIKQAGLQRMLEPGGVKFSVPFTDIEYNFFRSAYLDNLKLSIETNLAKFFGAIGDWAAAPERTAWSAPATAAVKITKELAVTGSVIAARTARLFNKSGAVPQHLSHITRVRDGMREKAAQEAEEVASKAMTIDGTPIPEEERLAIFAALRESEDRYMRHVESGNRYTNKKRAIAAAKARGASAEEIAEIEKTAVDYTDSNVVASTLKLELGDKVSDARLQELTKRAEEINQLFLNTADDMMDAGAYEAWLSAYLPTQYANLPKKKVLKKEGLKWMLSSSDPFVKARKLRRKEAIKPTTDGGLGLTETKDLWSLLYHRDLATRFTQIDRIAMGQIVDTIGIHPGQIASLLDAEYGPNGTVAANLLGALRMHVSAVEKVWTESEILEIFPDLEELKNLFETGEFGKAANWVENSRHLISRALIEGDESFLKALMESRDAGQATVATFMQGIDTNYELTLNRIVDPQEGLNWVDPDEVRAAAIEAFPHLDEGFAVVAYVGAYSQLIRYEMNLMLEAAKINDLTKNVPAPVRTVYGRLLKLGQGKGPGSPYEIIRGFGVQNVQPHYEPVTINAITGAQEGLTTEPLNVTKVVNSLIHADAGNAARLAQLEALQLSLADESSELMKKLRGSSTERAKAAKIAEHIMLDIVAPAFAEASAISNLSAKTLMYQMASAMPWAALEKRMLHSTDSLAISTAAYADVFENTLELIKSQDSKAAEAWAEVRRLFGVDNRLHEVAVAYAKKMRLPLPDNYVDDAEFMLNMIKDLRKTQKRMASSGIDVFTQNPYVYDLNSKKYELRKELKEKLTEQLEQQFGDNPAALAIAKKLVLRPAPLDMRWNGWRASDGMREFMEISYVGKADAVITKIKATAIDTTPKQALQRARLAALTDVTSLVVNRIKFSEELANAEDSALAITRQKLQSVLGEQKRTAEAAAAAELLEEFDNKLRQLTRATVADTSLATGADIGVPFEQALSEVDQAFGQIKEALSPFLTDQAGIAMLHEHLDQFTDQVLANAKRTRSMVDQAAQISRKLQSWTRSNAALWSADPTEILDLVDEVRKLAKRLEGNTARLQREMSEIYSSEAFAFGEIHGEKLLKYDEVEGNFWQIKKALGEQRGTPSVEAQRQARKDQIARLETTLKEHQGLTEYAESYRKELVQALEEQRRQVVQIDAVDEMMQRSVNVLKRKAFAGAVSETRARRVVTPEQRAEIRKEAWAKYPRIEPERTKGPQSKQAQDAAKDAADAANVEQTKKRTAYEKREIDRLEKSTGRKRKTMSAGTAREAVRHMLTVAIADTWLRRGDFAEGSWYRAIDDLMNNGAKEQAFKPFIRQIKKDGVWDTDELVQVFRQVAVGPPAVMQGMRGAASDRLFAMQLLPIDEFQKLPEKLDAFFTNQWEFWDGFLSPDTPMPTFNDLIRKMKEMGLESTEYWKNKLHRAARRMNDVFSKSYDGGIQAFYTSVIKRRDEILARGDLTYTPMQMFYQYARSAANLAEEDIASLWLYQKQAYAYERAWKETVAEWTSENFAFVGYEDLPVTAKQIKEAQEAAEENARQAKARAKRKEQDEYDAANKVQADLSFEEVAEIFRDAEKEAADELLAKQRRAQMAEKGLMRQKMQAHKSSREALQDYIGAMDEMHDAMYGSAWANHMHLPEWDEDAAFEEFRALLLDSEVVEYEGSTGFNMPEPSSNIVRPTKEWATNYVAVRKGLPNTEALEAEKKRYERQVANFKSRGTRDADTYKDRLAVMERDHLEAMDKIAARASVDFEWTGHPHIREAYESGATASECFVIAEDGKWLKEFDRLARDIAVKRPDIFKDTKNVVEARQAVMDWIIEKQEFITESSQPGLLDLRRSLTEHILLNERLAPARYLVTDSGDLHPFLVDVQRFRHAKVANITDDASMLREMMDDVAAATLRQASNSRAAVRLDPIVSWMASETIDGKSDVLKRMAARYLYSGNMPDYDASMDGFARFLFGEPVVQRNVEGTAGDLDRGQVQRAQFWGRLFGLNVPMQQGPVRVNPNIPRDTPAARRSERAIRMRRKATLSTTVGAGKLLDFIDNFEKYAAVKETAKGTQRSSRFVTTQQAVKAVQAAGNQKVQPLADLYEKAIEARLRLKGTESQLAHLRAATNAELPNTPSVQAARSLINYMKFRNIAQQHAALRQTIAQLPTQGDVAFMTLHAIDKKINIERGVDPARRAERLDAYLEALGKQRDDRMSYEGGAGAARYGPEIRRLKGMKENHNVKQQVYRFAGWQEQEKALKVELEDKLRSWGMPGLYDRELAMQSATDFAHLQKPVADNMERVYLGRGEQKLVLDVPINDKGLAFDRAWFDGWMRRWESWNSLDPYYLVNAPILNPQMQTIKRMLGNMTDSDAAQQMYLFAITGRVDVENLTVSQAAHVINYFGNKTAVEITELGHKLVEGWSQRALNEYVRKTGRVPKAARRLSDPETWEAEAGSPYEMVSLELEQFRGEMSPGGFDMGQPLRVERHIAEFISDRMFDDQALSAPVRDMLRRTVDPLTNQFKWWAIAVHPSSMMRNLLDGAIRTSFAIGMKAFNPKRNWDLFRILHAKDLQPGERTITLGGVDYDAFFIRDMLERNAGGVAFSEKIGIVNRTVEGLGDPALHPLSSNYFFRKGRAFKNVVDNMNGAMDNMYRASILMDLLDQGAPMGHAITQMHHVMFDYQWGLTPFERDIMRRMFPFYTFFRFNIPLSVSIAVKHPGFMAGIGKTHSVLSEHGQGDFEAMLPSYIRSQWRFGSKVDGTELKVFAGRNYLAMEDLAFVGKMIQTGKITDTFLDEVFARMNPLLKLPIELATGQNLYFGSELLEVSELKNSFLNLPVLNDWLQIRPVILNGEELYRVNGERWHILMQSHFARTYRTLADLFGENRKGEFTTGVAGFLTGLRMQSVDLERRYNHIKAVAKYNEKQVADAVASGDIQKAKLLLGTLERSPYEQDKTLGAFSALKMHVEDMQQKQRDPTVQIK